MHDIVSNPNARKALPMKTENETKTNEIPTIETTQLEDVTGGCAACGQASCKLQASDSLNRFQQTGAARR